MTDPHTHRTIAIALAEILPRRTNIFNVELIDATTDCTVRARIGESWAEREEIAGIGATMDEAVARLLDRADDAKRDDQIREIFDMSDEQVMAELAADGVTEAELERGLDHIRAMCAQHKARSDFARAVPPLSEIEIERLRQHAVRLVEREHFIEIDPLMVLGLVATLDRAWAGRRVLSPAAPEADVVTVSGAATFGGTGAQPRHVATVRGCVTAALAFAGVVGETMTPHELGMMTLGETWSLPGGVRIVRTTEDMFELWRDA